MKKVKKCKKYRLIFTARSRLQKKTVFINTDFFYKLKRALPCGKTLLLFYLEYYMQLMQLFALLSGI